MLMTRLTPLSTALVAGLLLHWAGSTASLLTQDAGDEQPSSLAGDATTKAAKPEKLSPSKPAEASSDEPLQPTGAGPSEPVPSAPAPDPAPDLAPGLTAGIDAERGAPLDPSALQSLDALHRALASKEQQVAEVQQRLVSAQDQVTQEELAERLRELRAELAENRQQFDRFALEIDLSPFVEEKDQPFDWQDELSKLLQPILAELKSATAESRAIGELRAELDTLSERKDLAAQAVERLQWLLQQEPTSSLRERLEERLEHWQRIASESANRYTALDLQLQNRLEQRQSLLDETTSYARNFFQTRGLNLLLALAAFGLVFFGVRWIASQVMRLRKPTAEKQFGSRLALLLLHAFSILGGLLAMMAVFNAAGDWFMLGIIIIFLLGVGWASIKTLPGQIESVKLILNVGTVREGERILFNEVPYRVDSLAFRAQLVNPELDGGVQQLPVRDLVGYHSRPAGSDEAWFPTRTGDWVELSEGLLGQVTHQSPSAVRLSDLGGAEIVYPTNRFLQQHPRRLSGRFRLVERFGIDYRHQAIATTEVPQRMQQALAEALPALLDEGQLRGVSVIFQAAGPSSLDYRVEVQLDGSAAPRSEIIRAAIQRILVDACNSHRWTIPFTQVTLHQATAPAATA
jgi:small-conductance mechanosensitive channel